MANCQRHGFVLPAAGSGFKKVRRGRGVSRVFYSIGANIGEFGGKIGEWARKPAA
jgi:hypothetical protein